MLRLASLLFATIAVTCAAHAREIVSWDLTRGGLSSLSDSSGYASTRTMIATDFPGTTIVGVSSFSAANLAGGNVVWLGSAAGTTTANAPLSAAEQSALVTFIQQGGTAVLFGENDTFTANASAANNSYFSPFSAHNTGTLNGTQAYTFPSPTAFPLTGPFGSVATLSSSYPGWFDTLPASAQVIADLAANSQPVIAMIPAGALGQGSGPVYFFGDTGAQADGGASGADWNTVYANILSQVPEPNAVALLALLVPVGLRRRSFR